MLAGAETRKHHQMRKTRYCANLVGAMHLLLYRFSKALPALIGYAN